MLNKVSLGGCHAWVGTVTYRVIGDATYPNGGDPTHVTSDITVGFTLDGAGVGSGEDPASGYESFWQDVDWEESYYSDSHSEGSGCAGAEQFHGSGRFAGQTGVGTVGFIRTDDDGIWHLDFAGMGGEVGPVTGQSEGSCPGHGSWNDPITLAQVPVPAPGYLVGHSDPHTWPAVDVDADTLQGSITGTCGSVGSFCGDVGDSTVTITWSLSRVIAG